MMLKRKVSFRVYCLVVMITLSTFLPLLKFHLRIDINPIISKVLSEGKHDSRKHDDEQFLFQFSDLQRPRTIQISCPLLFAGNATEQKRAMAVKWQQNSQQNNTDQSQSINCTLFKKNYITSPLTREEQHFPIAYSMLVFKDFVQVERLLRAIYRPQNFYCIHIDLKSDGKFRQKLLQIADCFENVFVTRKSVDVRWGTLTVLEPELLCMKELWNYSTWKYFINLTGQEFPLRTNAELVKILKLYNGTNDVSGTLKRADKQRWANAGGDPPAGIIPGKGSVHITVNRHFVEYVLHNQTARDFLDWCGKTWVPDETFFASLNHNPHLGIQGSADGYVEPYIMNSRFKNWGNLHCAGKVVRQICIFGVGDLPVLSRRYELFANKFYWDFQPVTLDCMEELLYNRTRDDYHNKRTFDAAVYNNLSFLKHRV